MSKDRSQTRPLFYRIVGEDLGEVVQFEPEGYCERVTEDGKNLVCGDFPTFPYSTVKETCFASSIPGCFLSNVQWLEPGTFWVYATAETPEVDLRNYTGYGDFGVVGKVRYRRPVTAVRVRKIEATPRFVRQFREIQRQCARDGDYDSFEAGRRLKKQKGRYPALSEKGLLTFVLERMHAGSPLVEEAVHGQASTALA